MPKLKNVLSGDDQFNFLIALIGLIHREGEIHITVAAERLGLSVDAVRKAMGTLVVAGHRKPSGAEVIPFNFDWDLFDEEQVLRFSDSDVILDAPRISTRQASAIAAGPYLSNSPAIVITLSTGKTFSCEIIASALSAKITATDSPIDLA